MITTSSGLQSGTQTVSYSTINIMLMGNRELLGGIHVATQVLHDTCTNTYKHIRNLLLEEADSS